MTKAKVITFRPKDIVFKYGIAEFNAPRELVKLLNEIGIFLLIKFQYDVPDISGKRTRRRDELILYRVLPHYEVSRAILTSAKYDERRNRLIIKNKVPPEIFPCGDFRYAMALAKAAYKRLKEISAEVREQHLDKDTILRLEHEASDIWFFAYDLVKMALQKRDTPMPFIPQDWYEYARTLGISIKDVIEFASRSAPFLCHRGYIIVAKYAYIVMKRAERLSYRLSKKVQ